jgi:hypothetical protein
VFFIACINAHEIHAREVSQHGQQPVLDLLVDILRAACRHHAPDGAVQLLLSRRRVGTSIVREDVVQIDQQPLGLPDLELFSVQREGVFWSSAPQCIQRDVGERVCAKRAVEETLEVIEHGVWPWV